MKRFLTFILNVALLGSGNQYVQCQSYTMTDCLSAFQVELPLDTIAFQQLVSDSVNRHPVLRYMTEDQFTYWYCIKVNASDSLKYVVHPTNETDQFQTVLYQYNDTSFCKDLVHGRIEEKEPVQQDVSSDYPASMSMVYSNTVFIESGQVYYLSVLSLNKDYCGHMLELEFAGSGIKLHALNKPCYSFTALEFDLPTESSGDTDTALDLSLHDDVLEVDETDDSESPNVDNKSDAPRSEKVEEPATSSRREATLSKPAERKRELKEPQLIDMELNEGDKLDLQNVFFHNNTYAFREDSENELKELLQLMDDNPNLKIEIGGHSAGNTKNIRPNPMLRDRGKAWDFKGSSKKLSKMRAEAVKTYLVDGGIAASRIKTKGYGDSQKIVENPKTPDDHRRNMRVEIAIISAE